MAESSRRASRGGPPNALFVVAAAERVPEELHGVADELTILFPWGSLLRGVLALDKRRQRRRGSRHCSRRAGSITAIVSIEDRDGLDATAARRRGRVRGAARAMVAPRARAVRAPAGHARTRSQATGSTWARRLRARSRARRLAPRAAAAVGAASDRSRANKESPAGTPDGPNVAGSGCRAPGDALVARLVRQADQRSADGRRRSVDPALRRRLVRHADHRAAGRPIATHLRAFRRWLVRHADRDAGTRRAPGSTGG